METHHLYQHTKVMLNLIDIKSFIFRQYYYVKYILEIIIMLAYINNSTTSAYNTDSRLL